MSSVWIRDSSFFMLSPKACKGFDEVDARQKNMRVRSVVNYGTSSKMKLADEPFFSIFLVSGPEIPPL